MRPIPAKALPILLLVPILALPAVAAAGPDRDGRIVMVDGDGGTVSIRLERDGQVLALRGDEGELVELDLSTIGDLVSEALAGLGEAMADLPEIEVRMGDDGILDVRSGGDAFAIDVARIGEAVEEAVAAALEGIEPRDRDRLRERIERRVERSLRHLHAHGPGAAGERPSVRGPGGAGPDRDAAAADLREQIRDLEREIEALREEMRRLRLRAQH